MKAYFYACRNAGSSVNVICQPSYLVDLQSTTPPNCLPSTHPIAPLACQVVNITYYYGVTYYFNVSDETSKLTSSVLLLTNTAINYDGPIICIFNNGTQTVHCGLVKVRLQSFECNGNGHSIGGISSCNCNPGFTDTQCAISCYGNGNVALTSLLYPGTFQSITVAGGSIASTACNCTSPWGGQLCNSTCNAQGVVSLSNPSICNCNTTFSGRSCQQECNGQGTTFNATTCTCDSEFIGSLCQIQKNANPACNYEGTLITPPSTCLCNNLFAGLTCTVMMSPGTDLCNQSPTEPLVEF